MAKSIERSVRAVAEGEFPIDLIDAHYFYPDGVAAAILARKLKLPLVITARGTDINLIPKYAIPRKMIAWAADQAEAIIGVSRALKERMIELGIDKSKISALRNGVDLHVFQPINQDTARQKVGFLQGRWLVSVGHLIERKGHHLIIEALRQLPDVNLAIIGDGPMRNELRALAVRLGVDDRVRILGAVNQLELPNYYSAADALVLASSREGMANVLLEAIACGLPVVATPIWGTPEVIASADAGLLTEDRSSSSLASSIKELFSNYPDRAKTRLVV
jgi:glycosyltransferase involved in cell wall biosynthesis